MFATLWYAGAVVATLGYNNMPLSDCENLAATMLDDIMITYDDPERVKKLDKWPDETKWDVTCEKTNLFIEGQ